MEDVLEFVLDGLEKALELERELGVRAVEIDRELLKAAASVAAPASARAGDAGTSGAAGVSGSVSSSGPVNSRIPPPPIRPKHSNDSNTRSLASHDLIFIHDRPLSEKGVEMMAKIVLAMGRTAENSPIVVAPPLPKARIVVVLGGLALKKYFPEMRGEPGQWQKTPEGVDVLITYSPEYILRFATVTPAVQKIKQDMWRSLKAVVQRLK